MFSNEVFHRLIKRAEWRLRLDGKRLAVYEELGASEHLAQHGRQAVAPFGVLFGALAEDPLGRFRESSVVLTADVFFGLEVAPQLAPKCLVVPHFYDGAAALGGAVEDRLGFFVALVHVAKGRQKRDQERAVFLLTDRGTDRSDG